MYDSPYFRSILGLIIPYAAFGLKWIVVFVTSSFAEKRLRVTEGIFDSGRQFRFLGWDFASASLGATIFAILYPASGISRWNSVPKTVVFIVLFGGLMMATAFVRYLVQEDREHLLRASRQRAINGGDEATTAFETAMGWSVICWLLGILSYATAVAAVVPG